MKKVLILAALTVAIVGCSKQEVGFDTLETARKQAKENAGYNAKAWRANTPGMSSVGIIENGDSTQTPDCPQGDGWATIELVDTATAKKIGKLKCSTVSGAVGCLTNDDFQTKAYAGDDGRCQPVTKVPHPLPKIAQ
jgi:hypothetical protein